MDRKCNTETQQFEHIHLQVEKLAVASVNEFRAVIGPGYFDDVNLGEKIIYKYKNNYTQNWIFVFSPSKCCHSYCLM